MATIDNLQIELTANTEKAIKSIKNLASAFKSLDKVSVNIDKTFKRLSDSVNRFASNVRLDIDVIERLGRALKMSSAFGNLDKATQKSEKTLKDLSEQIGAFSVAVKSNITDIERFANALDKISNAKIPSGISSVINATRRTVDTQTNGALSDEVAEVSTSGNIISAGKAFSELFRNMFKGKQSVEEMRESYKTLKQELADAKLEGNIRKLKSEIRSLKPMGKIVSALAAPFKALGTAINNTIGKSIKSLGSKLSSGFSRFFTNIINIIKYRFIRRILSEISEGAKEGLKNLYAYSNALREFNKEDSNKTARNLDKLASIWLRLKNVFAVTLASAIDAAMPKIEEIGEKIRVTMNLVNATIAALAGKDTYTKAKKVSTTWADGFEDGTEAIKEAERTLMGFDQINKLNDLKDSGSGTSDTDASNMFKEAEIPQKAYENAEKIREWVDKVADKVAEIKEWIDRASDSIGGIKGILDKISAWWNGVKKWWDDNGLAVMIGTLVGLIGGLALVVADLVKKLKRGATAIDTLGSAASALELSALTTAVEKLTDALKPVDGEVDEIEGEFDDLKAVLDPLATIVATLIDSSHIGGLTEAIKDLKTPADEVGNEINRFGNKTEETSSKLTTLIESTTALKTEITNFTKTDDKFKGWAKSVKECFKSVKAIIKTALIEKLKKALSKIDNFVTKSLKKFEKWADKVKGVFEEIYEPSFVRVMDNIYDYFAETLQKMKKLADDTEITINVDADTTDTKTTTTDTQVYHSTNSHASGGGYHSAQSHASNDNENILVTLRKKLLGFASGGFPMPGDLFIANEAGAEMVGSMNGKTAVANNQQIVDGIKHGVMEAMTSVMAKTNNAPVIENVFKVDSETLYKMTKKGEQKYNGRYNIANVF